MPPGCLPHHFAEISGVNPVGLEATNMLGGVCQGNPQAAACVMTDADALGQQEIAWGAVRNAPAADCGAFCDTAMGTPPIYES